MNLSGPKPASFKTKVQGKLVFVTKALVWKILRVPKTMYFKPLYVGNWGTMDSGGLAQ